jgi:undecaprenyl-diphosphatase
VGLAFERQVEARLGGVRSVALAQVGARLALWLADRRAGSGARPDARARPDPLAHLAVGAGQTAALVPGVSRAGAALTAARLRGLDRPSAVRLARRAALPVTLAASSLKALRLARAGLPRELRGPFAVGAAAALVSTRAVRGPAFRLGEAGSFGPLAAYRIVLGLAALARSCA